MIVKLAAVVLSSLGLLLSLRLGAMRYVTDFPCLGARDAAWRGEQRGVAALHDALPRRQCLSADRAAQSIGATSRTVGK